MQKFSNGIGAIMMRIHNFCSSFVLASFAAIGAAQAQAGPTPSPRFRTRSSRHRSDHRRPTTFAAI